jgi:hypothetical protein
MSQYNSNIIWGIPTQQDHTNAIFYALEQVGKERCTDPDIIRDFCRGTGVGGNLGGGNCIQWVQDDSKRNFAQPSNYFIKQCIQDSDCQIGGNQMGYCDTNSGMCTCGAKGSCTGSMDCLPDPSNPANLLCGWAPNVAMGNCAFATETACVNQGKLPYQCDDNGVCKSRPEDDPTGPNYPYTEWHTDDNGNGTCVFGNFVLRQYCENPASRCSRNPDGSIPPYCTSENERGVTNVPQFYYDKNKSQCYMTHDYCNVFDQDYNKKPCQTDSDCQNGDVCFADKRLDTQPYCVGPGGKCYDTTGQKIGKMTMGKTIFAAFNPSSLCLGGGGQKNSQITNVIESVVDTTESKIKQQSAPQNTEQNKRENYSDVKNIILDISKNFKNIPKECKQLCDERKMSNKIILSPNFAGTGINLYAIIWKNGGNTPGFIQSEVEKVYPNIIKIINGDKYITFKQDQIRDDKNLKRIFLVANSRGWMSQIIDKIVNNLSQNNK